MKTIQIFLVSMLLCISAQSDSAVPDERMIKQEITEFFDEYLAIYNRRFGQPAQSDQFRAEIAEVVTTPVMLAPPTTSPQVPDSAESFARGFDKFVTGLESKGVVRLQWHKTQIQILSGNKAIANNIGHGVTASGEIAYETISLYLLYRIDGQWKIAVFSPYLTDQALELVPAAPRETNEY